MESAWWFWIPVIFMIVYVLWGLKDGWFRDI